MADYYNLIVGWASHGPGQVRMEASRLFECTEDHIREAMAIDGEPDLEALAALPCLFIPEQVNCGDQRTKVGRVSNLRKNRRELVFTVEYDETLPAIDCNQIWQSAREMGFSPHDFQRSRSHWAVNAGNLHRLLLTSLPFRTYGGGPLNIPAEDTTEHDLVAVMMPFDRAFDTVFEAINRAANDANFRCIRADNIWREDTVMDEVVRLICNARIVVSDLTGRNANVFYETGIAHTLGKPVVMLTQTAQDIPFDLRHRRHLTYLGNGEGLAAMSASLAERLNELRQQ